MTTLQPDPSTPRKPIRLWPGVTLAVLQLALRLGLPLVSPEAAVVGGIGGVLCALLILIWWMFFSRVPHFERWGAMALMIAALALMPQVLHESITGGMMGMMFYVYAIPIVSLGLVAWAVLCRGLAAVPRRTALAATVVAACAVFALVRTDGILGGGGSQFAWRWTPTPEQRLLAEAGDGPAAPAPAPASAPSPSGTAMPGQPSGAEAQPTAGNQAAADAERAADARTGTGDARGSSAEPATRASGSAAPSSLDPRPQLTDGKLAPTAELDRPGDASALEPAAPEPEWPGFRGPNRDGRAPGIRIETDWAKSPPSELWRRAIGPGWSSFAVDGDRIYTQEQRGDDEVVSCYELKTGKPIWMHRDATRFWESNAGAGPRSTPTLSGGRVYTFGATGVLNVLDAQTGSLVWTRNAAADTETKVPYWGFASSPLVAGDLVVVATAGQLAAYDRATGEPRWTGPANGDGYSSPHRLSFGGVPQIVLLSRKGATSLAPADGALLWQHAWEGFASLQPALTAGGDLLLTTSGDTAGLGMRRLAVAQNPGGWTAEERWTSTGLKPYFNDFVVHEGHAYGFDGRILSSIDLENGEQKWKGGRYGNGQLIVLPDQDALIVLSDTGEVALVRATPAKFEELARIPAIEGKTWNHPAIAGDTLLVRNDREMAAFRLPPAR